MPISSHLNNFANVEAKAMPTDLQPMELQEINMRAETDLGRELLLNSKANTFADKIAKQCGVEDL